VRKAKTEQQRSLRTEADRVVVHETADRRRQLERVLGDVKDAARARELVLLDGTPPHVEVELAAPVDA
jgi:hypothetical protein